MPGLPTDLLRQPHFRHHHAPIGRLAHIVNRQQTDFHCIRINDLRKSESSILPISVDQFGQHLDKIWTAILVPKPQPQVYAISLSVGDRCIVLPERKITLKV
jgi:hypothetical protein